MSTCTAPATPSTTTSVGTTTVTAFSGRPMSPATASVSTTAAATEPSAYSAGSTRPNASPSSTNSSPVQAPMNTPKSRCVAAFSAA